jgi:hypothetical protein
MAKIRIRQMGRQYACNGFFPYENVKLVPGATMEIEDDDLVQRCVDTGLVEVVWEAPKRGRPRKDEESPE